MVSTKTEIYVYADWRGMEVPRLMGILSAQQAKGRKAFSFEYNKDWLNSSDARLLDPELNFYVGPPYPQNENFGVFLDSMPDTWGRTLMKRKAAQLAKEKNRVTPNLYDIDFLLGVYDETRMGALRFKTDLNGPFLDNDNANPTPPWSSVRELQHAVEILETSDDGDIKQLLEILIAPGSSLGGARPKANIKDENGALWIAKFPSKNDTIDRAAWEFLAYRLAVEARIDMAFCRIERLKSPHHTFFTKRFDREGSERIHFASAMTMTGNNEDTIRNQPASYLDIVEAIQTYGIEVNKNLTQLWRRIVFNICISNADDHLRNHGFLLFDKGWQLSPAYDLNPSIDKNGLSLNIDMDNNALDIELARSVGIYFNLNDLQMDKIIAEVKQAVFNWQRIANEIGISRNEQTLMRNAFVAD